MCLFNCSRKSRTVIATFALAMTCAHEAQATEHAGKLSVDLLTFASNDALEEASALTDAMRRAIARVPGLKPSANTQNLEALSLTLGCDDPMAKSCTPKIAKELKSSRFVYGAVKKTLNNKFMATLVYVENNERKTSVKAYQIGPSGRDGTSSELQAIASELLLEAMGGPPSGKLTVIVRGPAQRTDGTLYVDGKNIGTIQGGQYTLSLPSGLHRLEAKFEGFSSTESSIDLMPNGAEVEMVPVALKQGKPLRWQLYTGIGAVGLGALFLGIGLGTSIAASTKQDDPAFTTYRKRWPSTEKETCARAREGREGPSGGQYTESLASSVASLCNSVDTMRTLQFVWYGLGLAFSAGGAALLLTDKGGEKANMGEKKSSRSFELVPTVGRGYGFLQLSARF